MGLFKKEKNYLVRFIFERSLLYNKKNKGAVVRLTPYFNKFSKNYSFDCLLDKTQKQIVGFDIFLFDLFKDDEKTLLDMQELLIEGFERAFPLKVYVSEETPIKLKYGYEEKIKNYASYFVEK